MKKVLVCLLALLLTLALAQGIAAAEDEIDVSVEVTYEYQTARDVFTLVNAFRTSDTWQYDENNQKVNITGLQGLTYDDGLENVAMQRAAECAIRYAHERPNGQGCFTAYPSGGARGENIAAGYATAAAVFDGWKEEDKSYSGQGHRRNMLNSNFTCIGIGCVRANGTLFWCQAFSSKATGEAAKTLPSPYQMTASLSVLVSNGLNSVTAGTESLAINEGESAVAPVLKAISSSKWYGSPITLLNPAWQTTGSILTISGTTITGTAGGRTTLTWTDGTNSVELPVRVICKNHTPGEETVTKPATCTHPGVKTSVCTVCGEALETEIPVDPNAHVWGEPVYTWAEDCSRVDAARACTENPAHTESETAATTSSVKREATYADMGITTYTAVFVNPAFGKVEKDVENIPRKVLGAVALSSLKAGKQELTVKWKKGTDNDGYEIEYGLKKNFKGAKKVTVTKAKTTSWVISKLKAKKTYYVRIRAWKKVKGKKYYSEWSKVLKKKTK